MHIYEATFPVPAHLCAPGGSYEMERRSFSGQTHWMFARQPRTLNDVLAQAFVRNRAQPDARMTEREGEVISFGQYEARTAALAASLAGLGVQPGDPIAIAMANRAEWMMGFMAALAVGGVPVLVNSRGSGEEMHRAIVITDCTALICDAERQALLVAHATGPWRTIMLGQNPGGPLPTDMDFANATAGSADATIDFAPRDPQAPALIMFSSGTTGFPKAILHSQGGMAHAIALGFLINDSLDALYEREHGQALPHNLRINSSIQVQSTPMFHLTGLLPYMRAIISGNPTVLLSKWNTDALYDVLERETVSRLGLVPTMIFDMLASPRAQSGALANLRFLANGSAALDPGVAARIKAELPDCLLFNTYGQTECMERATCFGGQEYGAHLDGSGRVVPSYQVRLVRDDGSDVEPGEAGEVLMRAPCIMTGYYGNDDASAETLRDGWLHTGDIGRFDADGILALVDRKKNMVICGGENIYCAEVERVLCDLPGAIEAIAYGEPDPRLGERLVSLVVLRPGAPGDEEAAKAHAKAHLAIYKVPRTIGFTHTPLPRTATGKVARAQFLDSVRDKVG